MKFPVAFLAYPQNIQCVLVGVSFVMMCLWLARNFTFGAFGRPNHNSFSNCCFEYSSSFNLNWIVFGVSGVNTPSCFSPFWRLHKSLFCRSIDPVFILSTILLSIFENLFLVSQVPISLPLPYVVSIFSNPLLGALDCFFKILNSVFPSLKQKSFSVSDIPLTLGFFLGHETA